MIYAIRQRVSHKTRGEGTVIAVYDQGEGRHPSYGVKFDSDGAIRDAYRLMLSPVLDADGARVMDLPDDPDKAREELRRPHLWTPAEQEALERIAGGKS